MFVCIVILSTLLVIALDFGMRLRVNATEKANPTSDNHTNIDSSKCEIPYDDIRYGLDCVKIDITDAFQKDPSTVISTTEGNDITITVGITDTSSDETVSLYLWDKNQNKVLMKLDIFLSGINGSNGCIDHLGCAFVVSDTHTISLTQLNETFFDNSLKAYVELTFTTKAKKPTNADTQTYSAWLCRLGVFPNDQCLSSPGWIIVDRPLQIASRPVVLVHGLNDTAAGWDAYTNANGFLASNGLKGFAVDTLNTGGGLKSKIGWVTNTIDKNAQLLGDYIAKIKKATHASEVDLVTHSMGGLIARRYIAHYMNSREPDVNQLIMLGTPNEGSKTAEKVIIGATRLGWYGWVIAAVGWNYPAVLELTPTYLSWWNLLNAEQRGVPFYAVAGNLGRIYFECGRNPLEPFPNDIIVARNSVFAIPLKAGWTFPDETGGCNGMHTRMRSADSNSGGGPEIFNNYVKPLLLGKQPIQQSSIDAASVTDKKTRYNDNDIQDSDAIADKLEPNEILTFTWSMAPAATTNFVVIGTPSQMTVSLKDPNGNVFRPDSTVPGVKYVQIDEGIFPLTVYSVSNTIEGTWILTVAANNNTPPDGLTFAALTSMTSDLKLTTSMPVENLQVNKPITIIAELHTVQTPIPNANMTATLLSPDNTTVNLILYDDGQHGDKSPNDGIYSNQFVPTQVGVYGGVIVASGNYNEKSFNRAKVWAVSVEEKTASTLYLPIIAATKVQ